jgi:hypothetical protein
MSPIPVPPPVTTAENPETSKSFEALSSSLSFLPVAIVLIGNFDLTIDGTGRSKVGDAIDVRVRSLNILQTDSNWSGYLDMFCR